MVPPIFIDMLIFEFVVGPRVSDGTGGSPPPLRIHLLGPCQRPAFATSLAGYKLRLLLLWSWWISYAMVRTSHIHPRIHQYGCIGAEKKLIPHRRP